MNWEVLQSKILNTDLYTRSGTEVGVSEGTLSLKEKDGDYFVEKIDQGDIPSTCLEASSDLGSNYPAINEFVFGGPPKNWLIGNYKKIFIGHMTDDRIRQNGSSAGIITGSQAYLLGRGDIDGAIGIYMDPQKPWLTKARIATTQKEILENAQSKYTTAPVNHILAQLPGSYRSIAYTGLPEQIASIRKLQMINHPRVAPISYIFGTFYGEAIGFSAIKSFLRAHGIRDLNEIKSLSFRAGEWPGHMRIELHSGRVISVRKFHANYLIPSHITPFSLYQVDYTAELADLSVGDAWAPNYESRGKGWSVVIARTLKGLDLLESMQRDDAVKLDEIGADELIKMHSHGLDFKKRGAFIRIANRKAKGLPVPNYGYEPINIPETRKYFESILNIMFKVFQSTIVIRILEYLPISLIGWFFIRARNIWKKSTKTTKGGGLTSLRFRVLN